MIRPNLKVFRNQADLNFISWCPKPLAATLHPGTADRANSARKSGRPSRRTLTVFVSRRIRRGSCQKQSDGNSPQSHLLGGWRLTRSFSSVLTPNSKTVMFSARK